TGTGSRPLRLVRESPDVAPQTAVGPERRLTPTPEPASPRTAAAVPLAPPTGRAGGGLPLADLPADRAQHQVQHAHGTRLVQRHVAVAALGRLHARRAARLAFASRDRRAGGPEPAWEHLVTALGEACAAGVPVMDENGRP